MKKIFPLYFLFAVLFITQSIHANLKDPSILSVTEGEPDLNIADCVNALTGDFLVQQQDLVIQGAQPLPLQRFYISGNGEGILRGWTFFPQQAFEFFDDKDAIAISEPNGSTFYYKANERKRKKEWRSFSIDLSKGVVNTAHGDISGRSNLKNNILYKTNKKTFELRCGDGSVRCYMKSHEEDYHYRLRWERLPNNNLITWLYDEEGRLAEIATKNPAGNKTYASVRFSYHKRSNNFEAHTNDGRVLGYEFQKLSPRGNVPESHLLKKVVSPELPPETIDYTEVKHQGVFLSMRGYPGEKALISEYHSLNPHSSDPLRFRVKTLKSPAGENGTLITTHRFVYDPAGGISDIFDANQIKTRISFDTNTYRPKTIEFFDESGALHHYLATEWNGCGELTRKKLLDAHHHPIWIRHFDYDPKGNITHETLQGNLTGDGWISYQKRFQYQQDNLMVRQEEDDGPTITYTYLPGTNLVSSKILCAGGKVLIREFNEYDADNLLIAQITDDGTSPYVNDLSGVTERRIKRIRLKPNQPALSLPEIIEEKAWDPSTSSEVLLKKTVMHYSSEGRVIQGDIYDTNDRYCFSLKTTYDSMGHPTGETNALGYATRYTYDEYGNQTYVEEPNSILRKHLHYDKANRIVSEEQLGKDGQSRITTHSYDSKHNRIRTEDFHHQTTSYRYDPFGHLTCELLPGSNGSIHHAYDYAGNEIQITDPNDNTTLTSYNARGKPTKIMHPDGTAETISYYPNGNQGTSTDQNGTLTIYTYDVLGRVLTKTLLTPANEVLSSESFTYNSFHLISHTDPNGLTTVYGYDLAGRKCLEEAQTESGLEKTTYTYDHLGRLQTKQQDDLKIVTEYDNLDRLVEEREEDLQGHILTQKKYQYDPAGNCITTTEWTPEGLATKSTQYDSFNRSIKQIDALGHVTTISYNDHYINPHNQEVLQTTTIDPRGIQTIETYDIQDRLAICEKFSPEGDLLAKEELIYDPAGNKIAQHSTIISPHERKNKTTTWTYDSRHRVTSSTDAAGTELAKTTLFTYTSTGLLHTETLPNGIVLTHHNDPLGREIELISSDNSIHYSFTYNLLDQIIASYDHLTDTTITRTYDLKGRLLEETLPENLTLTNTYDTRGRRLSQTIANSIHLTYTYDPLYLRTITRYDIHNTPLYSHHYLTYDSRGQPTKQTTLSNFAINTEYDLLGRPVSTQTPYTSQTVLERDPAGNVLTVQTDKNLATYTYTNLSQLSSEKGLCTHTYAYDSHHNRLSKDSEIYSSNLLNQTPFFTYDKNGNPIQSTQTPMQLSYDALGRLTSIKTPTLEEHYTYDSWHRRLSKTTPHTTTHFLYDQQNEIGTYSNHEIHQFRLLGIGKGAEIGASVALELDNILYTPIHDLFGNITHLINSQGSIADHYQYSAFGEELTTPATSNPWRYSSKRHDSSGLIYFGRRYYIPIHGRWLTPDPAGPTDSPNLYAFVQCNPLLNIDLYGLVAEYNFLERTTEIIKGIALGTANFAIDTGEAASYIGFGLATPARWAYHTFTGEGSIKDDWNSLTQSNDTFRNTCSGSLCNSLNIDSTTSQQWSASTTQALEISTLLVAGSATIAKGISRAVPPAIKTARNLLRPATRPSLTPIPKSSANMVTSVTKSNSISTSYINNSFQTSQIWTSTKNKTSIQNAFNHWTKHSHEFPELSNSKQYVEQANKLFNNSGTYILKKVRVNGEILLYDTQTNTFGAFSKEGIAKTMFKPTDGILYWKRN